MHTFVSGWKAAAALYLFGNNSDNDNDHVGYTKNYSNSNNNNSNNEKKDRLQADLVVKNVLNLYSQMIKQTDLKPCTEVNEIFSELVHLSTKTVSDVVTTSVLENAQIRQVVVDLRRLCSVGECYMEAYWAEKIAAGETESDVYEKMLAFPYFYNYVDLTRMELSGMHSADETPIRNIAFIGSGPLPLTSLCLTGNLINNKNTPSSSITVLNIDSNPTAIEQSRNLCRRLGARGAGMQFLCAQADAPVDLRKFDAVYLAALVGNSQEEKESLLERVTARMRPGALLVIRSAERLRRLMYADFDPTTDRVDRSLEVCMAIHPFNHVVNSVIIGKVKAAATKTPNTQVDVVPRN